MSETKKEAKSIIIQMPMFRASYVNVAKPYVDEDGKASFGLTAILPLREDMDPASRKRLDFCEQVIWQAIEEKWNSKFRKELQEQHEAGQPLKKFKWPFRDGSTDFDLTKNPSYENKLIVNLRSYDRQPGCLDENKQDIILTSAEFGQQIYSGMYATATVNVFCFDHNKGGKGCSLVLRNVMKLKDGDRLAGVASATRDFEDVDTTDFGVDNAALLDEQPRKPLLRGL